MAIELGMPTNFYHYVARFEPGHMFTACSGSSVNEFISDDGVFVAESSNTNMNVNGCFGSDYRATTVNSSGFAIGGLNMETFKYGGYSSDYEKILRFRICALDRTGRPFLMVFRGNSLNLNSDICKFSSSGMPIKDGTLTVHKTELACPYKYCRDGYGPRDKAECVYVTGISAIMQYTNGTQREHTVIIARLPPSGKDYPVIGGTYLGADGSGLPIYNGDIWSKDGSALIYNDGTVEQDCLTGNTLSGITATELSLAMSDSVLESNTGLIAVACMVSGDGYARWVGYKNGIYKVYHGSEPLYGMPGESITIKGHNFRCLAYGPFYARLS